MSENETETPKLSIIITMCLQNDFIRKLDGIPKKEWNIFPDGVHINEPETKRLWNNNLDGFIEDIMKVGKKYESLTSKDSAKFKSSVAQYYHFIHIRDWHDDTDPDPAVQKELETYGLHCIKGTEGAKFINPLDEYVRKYRKFNIVVNSDRLNSFFKTGLENHLKSITDICGCSKNQIDIGIIGVATNIKILFLVYDLTVFHGYADHVYVCEDLSAAFTGDGHKQGIEYIKQVLDVECLTQEAFKEKMNLKI